MISRMASIQKDQSEVRSRPSYPYYSLAKCLEFGRAVRELGGNTGSVARSLIAQQLAVEENSSSMTQLIIATKTFGIVEGRGEFSLTSNGKRYFYPTSEQEKKLAQLAFLAAPSVFSQLLEKFDGNRLPNAEMLGNLILGMGVPESWKQRVASLFVSSLKDVAAVDSQGIIRVGAAKHQKHEQPQGPIVKEDGGSEHSDALRNKAPNAPPPAPSPPQQTGTINFPIGPDRYLTVPKDLTVEDCASIETILPALQAYAKRLLPKQEP
jgi:hypothetical protein